jgi:DNA-binding MarR family transcriptional regulator
MIKGNAEMKNARQELIMSNYLFYYMQHIVTKSRCKIESAMRFHGIRAPMWRVIMILRQKKSLSISEIAEEVLLEKSRLSRIAKVLTEKGIVQRAKCEDDQRFTRIELTEKGHALFETLIPIAEQQMENILAGFSYRDRQKLDQMMHTMKDNAYSGH